MIGKTISHYRIVSELGAGGMGIVYVADDLRLGRSVALKFVPEDLAKDDQALMRLRGEARTASALTHPGICTIYDFDEGDGRPFIVMELLRGQNLLERTSTRPLRVAEVVDIGIQVAEALDCAHSRGVIHRDIKPTNLFLVDRGHVKIVDFGLAKQFARHPDRAATTAGTTDLTSPGTTLGTVAYMSPEQVTGEELDGRTDVFSFGVVLYECITGHQPFSGKTAGAVMAAILNKAPVAPVIFNPELPPRMQEVINNCLEKDRELRYQSAADLRADLKRIKRDLESGRSQVLRIAGVADAATTGSITVTELRTTSANMEAASSAARAGRRLAVGPAVAGAIVVAAILVASGVYLSHRMPESSPVQVTGLSERVDRRKLDSAEANLRARNYRAALSESEEILKSDPTETDAIRIRDEAATSLTRFDQAVARAADLLSAGNAEAATQAIDTARSIDPAAAIVGELSARLIGEFRARAEAARRPAPVVPAATGGVSSVRQALDDPARRETPRATAPPESPPSNAPASASTALVPPSPATTAPPNSAPPPVAGPLAPPTPNAPPAAADAPRETSTAPASAAAVSEDDDAAIGRVVAAYARAIETKDVSLFRSIKPNMSPQEQRRIEEGFRAVSSQRVKIAILGIDRQGQDASVRLRRTDVIEAGGRQQTSETQQTMTLMRSGPAWVIRELGR